jgi:hypothetical protein
MQTFRCGCAPAFCVPARGSSGGAVSAKHAVMTGWRNAETPKTKSETRQTIGYVRDGILILALALGAMYVLAHPEKFDAFMNWTIGQHYRS